MLELDRQAALGSLAKLERLDSCGERGDLLGDRLVRAVSM
jgi:hypothetical protein